MAPRVRVRLPKEAADVVEAGIALFDALVGSVRSAKKVVRRTKRLGRRAKRAANKVRSNAESGARILIDAAEEGGGAVTVDLSGAPRRRRKAGPTPADDGGKTR